MEPACPKIVLDIGTLGYAHDSRREARGVHRVAQYLFKGLVDTPQCDLRFVATSNLAGAYEFLQSQGLSPDRTLGFHPSHLIRSRVSRASSQWVHRNIKDRRLPARLARRLASILSAQVAPLGEDFPARVLDGADLYHSPLAPIPAAVRARKNLKHFLTVHDLLPLTKPECLGGDARPYINRLLGSLGPDSFVFCVTESVKNDLLNYAPVPREQVFVTHLAADRQTFYAEADEAKISSIRRQYGIPAAPYFLSLSSFDPRKNFGHIIQCFSRLVVSKEVGDCNLLIVGSNPERNTFVTEAIARCPEIRSRIITPGYIPDADLAAIYSGALAFLFPSHGEGFGIPPLEAMQCGTPVVSSNCPALPEVLGDAAILLDPMDADGWCQAMISVSRDASLRQELKEKGLARAEKFSWERFTESTLRGYAAALG